LGKKTITRVTGGEVLNWRQDLPKRAGQAFLLRLLGVRSEQGGREIFGITLLIRRSLESLYTGVERDRRLVRLQKRKTTSDGKGRAAKPANLQRVRGKNIADFCRREHLR